MVEERFSSKLTPAEVTVTTPRWTGSVDAVFAARAEALAVDADEALALPEALDPSLLSTVLFEEDESVLCFPAEVPHDFPVLVGPALLAWLPDNGCGAGGAGGAAPCAPDDEGGLAA